MQQRLTMITLGVSDLVRSTAFYESVFGWVKTPSSSEQISFFQLNGIQLALFDREALADDVTVSSVGNGFRGVTLAYNVRSEEEVQSLFEQLRSKGVEIIKAPQKTDWGGFSGYIADPDGYLWEIAHNPFLSFDEQGHVIG